ncbi:MAG: TetR/AcrR family transcriptional regulator [Caulobacterales bacterium]|nr:TetR/AcrR family transcriptional regulator [Caulobacterales bacterium]
MPTVRARRVKTSATPQLLLETAGEVFAAVGFEGASGRDICERAGVSSAAINYYFGGIEGLHEAVVAEAIERVVGLAPVLDLIGSGDAAEQRLISLFQFLVETALENAGAAGWPMKVLTQEALRTSDHLDALRDSHLVPQLRIVRALLAEFMELPEDHGAVTDACVAYLSVSIMLHMADHKALESAFPPRPHGDQTKQAVVGHLTEFMLGGVKRLADLAKSHQDAASGPPDK